MLGLLNLYRLIIVNSANGLVSQASGDPPSDFAIIAFNVWTGINFCASEPFKFLMLVSQMYRCAGYLLTRV